MTAYSLIRPLEDRPPNNLRYPPGRLPLELCSEFPSTPPIHFGLLKSKSRIHLGASAVSNVFRNLWAKEPRIFSSSGVVSSSNDRARACGATVDDAEFVAREVLSRPG